MMPVVLWLGHSRDQPVLPCTARLAVPVGRRIFINQWLGFRGIIDHPVVFISRDLHSLGAPCCSQCCQPWTMPGRKNFQREQLNVVGKFKNRSGLLNYYYVCLLIQ